MGEKKQVEKNLEVISQGPAAKKLLFFVLYYEELLSRSHQGAFCYMQGGQTGGWGVTFWTEKKKTDFL